MCINIGKKNTGSPVSSSPENCEIGKCVEKFYLITHFGKYVKSLDRQKQCGSGQIYIQERRGTSGGGEQKDSENKRQRRGTIDKRIDTAKDKFWKIC